MLSDEAAEANGSALCEELVMVYDWLHRWSVDGRALSVEELCEKLNDRALAIEARFKHLEPFGGKET